MTPRKTIVVALCPKHLPILMQDTLSAQRQRGLNGYCFKYIDRSFCLWTDAVSSAHQHATFLGKKNGRDHHVEEKELWAQSQGIHVGLFLYTTELFSQIDNQCTVYIPKEVVNVHVDPHVPTQPPVRRSNCHLQLPDWLPMGLVSFAGRQVGSSR